MSASKGIVLSVPVSLTSDWPDVLSSFGFRCLISKTDQKENGQKYVCGTIFRDHLHLEVNSRRVDENHKNSRIADRNILMFFISIDSKYVDSEYEAMFQELVNILENKNAILEYTNLTIKDQK